MTDNKQPKDYTEEFDNLTDFQTFLKDEYGHLNTWQRIIYRLQDSVLFFMVFCFVVGYFAGEHFGVFW